MRAGSVAPDDGQIFALIIVRDRYALAPSSDPVLQRAIIKLTKITKHLRKRVSLRAVRIDTEFIAKYHVAGFDPVLSGRCQERASVFQHRARSSFVPWRMGKEKELQRGTQVRRRAH